MHTIRSYTCLGWLLNHLSSKAFVLLSFLTFTFTWALAHQPPETRDYEFVENKNQWNKNVLFRTDVPAGAMFLEKNCITYHLFDKSIFEKIHGTNIKDTHQVEKIIKAHAFKVRFEGANPDVIANGDNVNSQLYNYFLGNDQSKWSSRVKSYREVTYENIYPGTQLKFYSFGGNLKYDFILNPEADPLKIQLLYEGIDQMSLKNGNLIIKTNAGDVIERAPYAYQVINGQRRTVPCQYVLKDKKLSFAFPKGYNSTLPLIIDPTLIFSTYSGSHSNNFGYTATFDSEGFLYSGSTAFGPNYPTTIGAYDVSFNSVEDDEYREFFTDIAITKYDTTGTKRIYSTFIGGQYDEMPHSLVVNSKDELYIFGTTGSPDYPFTSGAYDSTFAGGFNVNLKNGIFVQFYQGTDIIVSKLSNDGSALLASTFLGGTGNEGINYSMSLRYNYADEVRGEIDIDAEDNIYIVSTTGSVDFPVTAESFQPTYGGGGLDAFVVKMNSSLSEIIYGSFFGGNSSDAAYSLALDDSLNVYIAGGTISTTIPVTSGVLGPAFSGGRADGFIAHISKDGTTLLHSTYYGSSAYDQIYFIELDRFNNVYVFGQTEAPGNTFIHNAAYNRPNSGQFISKMTFSLDSLIWSTAFGTGIGGPNISPTAFLVDLCNKIYLSGWGGITNMYWYLNNKAGYTTGMDVTPDAYRQTTDGSDFYLMVLEDDASALSYGSFYGGTSSFDHVDGGTSRFDRKGKMYQAVCASCGGHQDFPIHPNPGAVSASNNSSCNSAVFKFDFNLPIVVADFVSPFGCANAPVNFINTSLVQKATQFFWDFGDNTTSTERNPTHTYTSPGIYKVKLVLNDNLTCNLADTLVKNVEIRQHQSSNLPALTICPGQSVQIGLDHIAGYTSYTWSPVSTLNNHQISNPVASPLSTTDYTMLMSNGICVDTVRQRVNVPAVVIDAGNDRTLCRYNLPATLNATSNNAINYTWSLNKTFSPALNSGGSSSVSVNPSDVQTKYYVRGVNSSGCSNIDSILVTIEDISYTVSPGRTICSGDTAILRVNKNVASHTYNYSWSPTSSIQGPANGISAIVRPTTTTTYTVVVSTPAGCIAQSQITVTLDYPQSTTLTPLNICPGQSASIGIAPIAGYSYYSWTPATGLSNPAISNPLATPAASTTYMLQYSDGICMDTLRQRINLQPANVDAGDDRVVCSNTGNITLNATSTNAVQYEWATNKNFNPLINSGGSSSVTINPLQPINKYYVRATNSFGCTSIDSIIVRLSDYSFTGETDKYICIGDTVELKIQQHNPEDTITYSWTPSTGIIGPSTGSSILVSPTEPITYTANLSNNHGCTFLTSVDVNISPVQSGFISAWTDKDTIYRSQSTNLHVRPLGYNYVWLPDYYLSNNKSSDPNAKPDVTTTYTVSLSDPLNNKCRVDTVVTVYVIDLICGEPEIYVPNAFTPNGDGNNDKIFVRGRNIEKLLFIIYNRWGEKVFESNDMNKGWDGTYLGKPVNPDVFVYYLEAYCIDGQEYFKKGNITVIR
ncbi:MAG: gliding motility-associated C-terminal domain-containing protein [Cytophagaceae bacterium]